MTNIKDLWPWRRSRGQKQRDYKENYKNYSKNYDKIFPKTNNKLKK